MFKFEQPTKSKLDDPEFMSQVIERISDVVHDPKWSDVFDDPEKIIRKLKSGEKIDLGSKAPGLTHVVENIGQDLGLDKEDINKLKEKIF